MLYTKLSIVVKALQLRYAIPFVLLLVAVYWLGIYPWMENWGSTAVERQMPLVGDDLYPDHTALATKALTINAPPDVVWQWLVQIGQDRAGFYTYTWLENIVGADIHNTNEIRLEWQHLAVGDAWRLVPPDYLVGIGKDAASPVLIIETGRAIVLEMFGAHVIVPINENSSRLIVRGQSGQANLLTMVIWDPLVFTLERRMLLGLKARAEGRPDAPVVLTIIAHIGWAAAAITVASLFVSHRQRRYWLVLPILAALPALLMSSDIQAATAAFLAVGIPLLGFLFFGRSWWGSLLVIASLVLLTLLLAQEAYSAFGMIFFLLLLAALGVMITDYFRTVEERDRRLSASVP